MNGKTCEIASAIGIRHINSIFLDHVEMENEIKQLDATEKEKSMIRTFILGSRARSERATNDGMTRVLESKFMSSPIINQVSANGSNAEIKNIAINSEDTKIVDNSQGGLTIEVLPDGVTRDSICEVLQAIIAANQNQAMGVDQFKALAALSEAKDSAASGQPEKAKTLLSSFSSLLFEWAKVIPGELLSKVGTAATLTYLGLKAAGG